MGRLPLQQSSTFPNVDAPKEPVAPNKKVDGSRPPSSDLSSIDSDSDTEVTKKALADRKTSAPARKSTVSKPKPVAAPSRVAGGPASRAPNAVAPPTTSPLFRANHTPMTSKVLAQLHFRSFMMRFTHKMPTLDDDLGPKVEQTLAGLSDDPSWFWSRSSDFPQRLALQGLLELLEGQEGDVLNSVTALDRLKALRRSVQAPGAAKRGAEIWGLLKELATLEREWRSSKGWGKKAKEWVKERERREADEDEDEVVITRASPKDIDPDEKLALLCVLIDMALAGSEVRAEFSAVRGPFSSTLLPSLTDSCARTQDAEDLKKKNIEVNKRRRASTKSLATRRADLARRRTPGPAPTSDKHAAWLKSEAEIDEMVRGSRQLTALIPLPTPRSFTLAVQGSSDRADQSRARFR